MHINAFQGALTKCMLPIEFHASIYVSERNDDLCSPHHLDPQHEAPHHELQLI